jgi:hypothetical protein
MAEKLTDRTAIAVAVTQSDLLHVVDVSDSTQDPAGSSYKATTKQIINSYLSDGSEGAMPYWDNSTSKYIPISTSGIYHDAVNNRIGVGINTSLQAKLHVKSATGTAFQVDGSTLTSILNVANAGNVMVNTSTPDGVMTVYETYANYVSAKNIFSVNRDGNNLARVRMTGAYSNSVEFTAIDGLLGLTVSGALGSFSLDRASYSDYFRTQTYSGFVFGVSPSVDTEAGIKVLSTMNPSSDNANNTNETLELVISASGTNQGQLRGIVVQKGTFTNPNAKFYPLIIKDGSTGFGTDTPNASSLVELSSTTQGFLPPRMTTTQRDAISTPAEGLVIYNTTTQVLNFYNGTTWGAV